MATVADLKGMLLRILDDSQEAGSPIAGKQYNASLLLEAIQAGLDAILPWMPKSNVATLTGDGSTTAFALPVDLYRIESVWDEETYHWLSSEQFIPGGDWADPAGGQTWMEYPQGYITFAVAPTSGKTVKVYYSSPWTKPTGDASTIESPSITHLGVVLFGASYCLLPKATSAANIRQFATKVDSGIPIHNPMADMSTTFLKRFELEMSRHPYKAKGAR